MRPPPTDTKRLLLVDDDLMVLRAVARELSREFEVTPLTSPVEALRRMTLGESWDAVLSDVTMPEMTGLDFARRAVAASPGLASRVALMTGGMFRPEERAALVQSGFPMFEKPLDMDAVRACLLAMASGSRSGHAG